MRCYLDCMAPCTYQNRQGKTYYLHSGPKRGGGTQCFVSQSAEGELLDAVPEGFELYETPNAQVYLRRRKPSLIAPEEVAAVQRHLDKRRPPPRYRVEIRSEHLTIYESTTDLGGMSAWGGRFSRARIEQLDEQFARYQPVMRFVLCERQRRLFAPERFCFRGSVDDWISIGAPETIEKLANLYLKYLGTEAIYELY